ncbi:MAG: hypothetical protein ACE5GL_03215, partial [Calditrichia bacterium]
NFSRRLVLPLTHSLFPAEFLISGSPSQGFRNLMRSEEFLNMKISQKIKEESVRQIKPSAIESGNTGFYSF